MRVENSTWTSWSRGRDPVRRDFAEGQGAASARTTKIRPAVMVFPDGFTIDVAPRAVDIYLKPAALPTVEYSSLKQ